MGNLRDQVKLKSVDEILEKLHEMVRRYRRRYLKSYLRPCPNNCTLASMAGNRVIGCNGCKSRNPEKCSRPELYQPITTKEELAEEFRLRLQDPEVLRRDYPAIAVFLWVLGELDKGAPEVITKAED